MNDMNLPFEPQQPTMHTEEMSLSGGVVVAAVVMPSAIGLLPMLMFRFAHADGSGFMEPIALSFSRDQLEELPELIRKAMLHALEVAGR